MRKPSSRGASWRMIVSTSGSSGTAQLTPGDVPAPSLSLEGDPLAGGGAAARGLRHRGAEGGHVEHPAAGRPQGAGAVADRSGVEHQDVGTKVARQVDGGAAL